VAVLIGIVQLVDRNLELVRRVEGDLANLGVLLPIADDISFGQFSTFQNSGFRRVSGNLSLENVNALLLAFELGPVTQSGATFQGLPSGCILVEACSGLVLASVGLHNLVVEPHVSDSHPVLCQSSGLV
jgi:hypothetical protein